VVQASKNAIGGSYRGGSPPPKGRHGGGKEGSKKKTQRCRREKGERTGRRGETLEAQPRRSELYAPKGGVEEREIEVRPSSKNRQR